MADLSEPMVSVYVDESDLDMMTTGNQLKSHSTLFQIEFSMAN
jgi:hypothetical protein